MVALLSSCYSTTYTVGNLDPTEPLACVSTVRSPHYVEGLVKEDKVKAEDVVGNIKNYKVENSIEFVDVLFSTFSFGLYTPTTTKYYVPVDQADRVPHYVQTNLPRFCVRAGGNMFLGKVEGTSSNSKWDSGGLGVHLGVLIDIPLGGEFFFQPGVAYSSNQLKGSKDSYTDDTTLQKFQVPIVFAYKYPMTNLLSLQVGGGPYAALELDDGEFCGGIQLNAGVIYQKHYYAGITFDRGIGFYGGNELRFGLGYNF